MPGIHSISMFCALLCFSLFSGTGCSNADCPDDFVRSKDGNCYPMGHGNVESDADADADADSDTDPEGTFEGDCDNEVDDDLDGYTDCYDVDCTADAACATTSTGTSPPEGCWEGNFMLSGTQAIMGSDTCDGGLIDPANADLSIGLQYNSVNEHYDVNGSGTCTWQGPFGPLFTSMGWGTPTLAISSGTFTGPDASGIYTIDIAYNMGFVSNTITATSNSATSFTIYDGTQSNPTNFTYSVFSGTYYATLEVNWATVAGPNGCP